MHELIIREMEIEDFNKISDILTTEFDDFWNENILNQELQNENSKCFTALINDEIVGFIGIWKALEDMHITNIVTKKKFRQKGIGSKLLEKAISYSKGQNVNTLTLEVHEENIIAQKLYEKYNFKILGKRKNYYKNNKSALIMTLNFKEE